MSLSITNYSQNTINKVIESFAYLEDNTTTSNKTFNIKLKLDTDVDNLELQARVFASNYSTHGHINFYKALRINRDDVEQTLYELFVYSYVKSLYNGLFFANMSDDSELGLVLQGHAYLFYVIKSKSLSTIKDEVYLSYDIKLGSIKYREALIAKLIMKFNFLKEFIDYNVDNFGNSPFQIRKYEAYFNYLTQDYYAKDNVKQGVMDQADAANGISKDSKYPNGKLTVLLLNKENSNSILKFANNPVMNAFLSDKLDEFYFVPILNGNKMVDNPAVFFCKANHISLDGNQIDQEKLERIYNKIVLNDKTKHTVLAEVFTISGIICRFTNVQPKPEGPNIKIPTTKDLENLIGGKGLQSILEWIRVSLPKRIAESEDGEDIEIDIYNILLELFSKSQAQ